MVSIPHRYAKNGLAVAAGMSGTAFQFLIGTLKTAGLASLILWCAVFQFLIGTLKTPSSGPK